MIFIDFSTISGPRQRASQTPPKRLLAPFGGLPSSADPSWSFSAHGAGQGGFLGFAPVGLGGGLWVCIKADELTESEAESVPRRRLLGKQSVETYMGLHIWSYMAIYT